MARILSAWFPAWPIVRRRSSGEAPAGGLFATVRTERARHILASLSPEAVEAGLRPGMALAHAYSFAPELLIADDDPAADLAGLEALAVWAKRYTRRATCDATHGPAEGLLLDITGCADLFGGEDALIADLWACLSGAGITVCIAIAGTVGAAWALARAPQAPSILPEGRQACVLGNLPVGLLRLPEPLVAALARLGLRRIEALARLPRADLASRFGTLPGIRLDQAFGLADEPVAWPGVPVAMDVRLPIAERDPMDTGFASGTAVLAVAESTDAACQGERRPMRRADPPAPAGRYRYWQQGFALLQSVPAVRVAQ